MSAFQFIITDAGKAAMALAGQFGPVTLGKISVGSAGYTPSSAQSSLQQEIKQLIPEGSSASGPGIIHITAKDNSADKYTIREVGLLTSEGILFAIHSQTEDILVKSVGGVALLAFDFAITNLPAESVTIGDAQFQYPPATETVKGVAGIATQEDVNKGLDDSTIVTPLKLANATCVKNTITTERIADESVTVVKIAKGSITSFQLNNSLKASIVPAGCVAAFAGVYAPGGWLKANGAAVPRATYPDLYAVIGIHYGAGDGSTTFNLPDLRGQFVRGWDDGRGVNPGRGFGSWEGDEFRSHSHNFVTNPASIPTSSHHHHPERILTENTPHSLMGAHGWIQNAGGSETRPINVALLYCIKY